MKTQNIKTMPPAAGPYPEDDIPNYIQKITQKMAKKPRIQRSDLQIGQVVIVLEGEFTGMRVVVVDIINFNLICIGLGIPMFKIDQRYVLKTSMVMNIKDKVEFKDFEKLEECNKQFEMKTTESTDYDSVIEKELEKMKMVKSYFERKFVMPEGYDFYELNY